MALDVGEQIPLLRPQISQGCSPELLRVGPIIHFVRQMHCCISQGATSHKFVNSFPPVGLVAIQEVMCQQLS